MSIRHSVSRHWARALLAVTLGAAAPVMAQNVNVNPGAGTYPTLSAAFAAINAGTHTGAVTVDIVADTVEPTTAGAASVTLNASGSGAASYSSILVRPSGGAARTVSGAATAGFPLIDLNGADNVTFDGLNTGGNALTIANTTVSASSGTATVRFINGATGNTITNSSLQGAGAMSVATNGAVVFFSTDGVTANGNDNNTISNNDIGPVGTNLPSKAILGNGSTTTTAIGNSGIVISNNNIHDFFAAAVTSAGIATNGGCNAWTISNNRFYQTATRTWTTGATHRVITITPTTATQGAQGFTITGNLIGFASSTQTGTYALTGSTGSFIGIHFNGITGGTLSTISNNTIASVALTGVTSSGTSTSSPFIGILLQNGLVTSSNNVIGSQSGTGSLTFSTTTTTTTDVYGIYNFTVDDWTANGNSIGGISVTNLSATGTTLLFGMRANTSSTKTNALASNLVGGTAANSLQVASGGTASQVIGINDTTGIGNLTSNTVRNLTNNNGTGTTTSASVIGILITTTSSNHTVSQNTISALSNSNATAATVVTGLQFNGSTANVVERNSIFGLSSATTSAAAEINGIRVAGGTTVYRNNMIAIGAGTANAIGAVAANGSASGINGINELAGTNSFFHNSVFVGGSPTAGTGASYAFNSTQVTVTRAVRDNIFVNARSNAGATGKHYAIKLNGTAANPVGLTINNNLYFANGSGAAFGFFNSLDVANLAAWRTAVGQDANSFESDPQYLDPNNAVPNLHLNGATPTIAEANGADVGVIDDFDGQVRSGLTPVDIGADAGNFIGIDLTGPVITYTPLVNTTSTSNRSLTASISDGTGVPVSGIGLPVIYYRKGSSGAFVSTQATSGGGSSYTFTLDYSLLGGVTVGDTIQYYVVAQDTAAALNVSSSPSAGAGGFSANPPAAATPPTTPNSYVIAVAISGVKTVCAAGCDYATLTAAGGAFAQINGGVLTGNLELQIAGDLTVEDGSNALNAYTEQPGNSNFTVRIYPTGAPRIVSGAFNGALLRFAGASRVTVDGSLGGSGTDRSLTLTNTSATSPSVVLFGSVGTTPVTADTLKNCIVINGANTSSAVVISDATTLGNAGLFSNITIQNNDVQKAFVGVFATGGTTPQGGSNLVYAQNKIDTSGANAVRDVGLYMQGVNGATVTGNSVGNLETASGENDVGIWLATGTINATVSGNTVNAIGYSGTSAFAPIGINVTSSVAGTNNIISGNTVSNITSAGTTNVRGIVVSGATSDLSLLSNNVQGVINSNTGTFGAYGIDVNGGNNVTVRNNVVSNVNHDMTGGAAFSTTFGVFGIRVGAGTGHQIQHNSVNLYGPHTGTATTSLLSAAFAIVATSSTGMDVRDNIFANNITGGTTSIAHVAVYLPAGGTSAMALTLNNNAYYSGSDAARQGVGQAGSTAGTNFFTTLAAQAAYSATLSAAGTDDNASLASTGAVPFVGNTDLHLQAATAPIGAGVFIPAVTTDIDGDPRVNFQVEIGADEVAQGILAIAPTALPFGNVAVGGTSAGQTVTLSNTGTASLDVTAIDAASAPFALSGGTCGAPSFALAVGASCTLSYTFSPTATGAANQTVNITSTSFGSGSVTLSGTGVQGNLTISPTSLAFGSQGVGTTSSAQTVTLSNTGNASLNVTALDAAGAPFARSGGSCSAPPITIAAGGSCTLDYTFSPSVPGAANQTLTVTANAPGSGTIALSGTGVQGSLTISPTTVAFGSQLVGSTSAAQTVTLSNTGTAALSATVSAPTAPFALAGGSCPAAPIALAPGDSCTLGYTFAPSATGAANQVLTVTANAPGSGTIALSGAGIQGNLTITPTSVPFGNVPVSTTSSPQTVTLSNAGTASLNVTALTAATAPFALSGGTCSAVPITLAAGASCTLTYTFAPTAASSSNQTLTVTANAPGSGTIALSGTGQLTAPTITAPTNQTILEDGTTGPLTVTIGDTQTAASSLVLTVVSSSNTAVVPTANVVLGGSGASRTVTVSPAANAFGTSTITLRVTDGDNQSTDGSFQVSVTSVNDVPSFSAGANQTRTGGVAGPVTVSGWATAISAGPANESGQALNFIVNETSDPNNIVSATAVSATGTLSYTLSGVAGTAQFTVAVHDDGGTANGGVDTSATQSFTITVSNDADLSIVKTSSLAQVDVGLLKYTLVVRNLGSNPVTGAQVVDTLPATLTGVTWTCTPSGGASCTASGSGNISQLVNLPGSAQLTYAITTTVPQPVLGVTFVNTATVAVPSGVNDPDPSNNTSTVTDRVDLFKDGFEDPGMLLNVVTLDPAAKSLMLSGATLDGLALDEQAIDALLFDIDGTLALIETRRIAGQAQARVLSRAADGHWSAGTWTDFGAADRVYFDWSAPVAGGVGEVQSRLRIER